MKKTRNGTILGVLLVWTIYFFHLTRDLFDEALAEKINVPLRFGTFLFTAAILFVILFLMLKNSVRDKKPAGFMDRMRANSTISEEDEREKRISADVTKKNYVSISNFIIIFMMVFPMFTKGQMFTMDHILIFVAVFVTIESMMFLYRFYRLYNA
ncbi:hypothetical protein [Proteiniclasticum sp.]|uniref:hypothetical protein n=1 Tax=Proteiniclasticum sp. TaxID=2053595 RepID=UPI00289CCD79|nr:hypothetical protein [Proteiniclasticum sp.]